MWESQRIEGRPENREKDRKRDQKCFREAKRRTREKKHQGTEASRKRSIKEMKKVPGGLEAWRGENNKQKERLRKVNIQ